MKNQEVGYAEEGEGWDVTHLLSRSCFCLPMLHRITVAFELWERERRREKNLFFVV